MSSRVNQETAVVFITGASNGLGRALALVYAQAGHDLLLTGRDPKALQDTVDQAKQTGVTVLSIVQDLEEKEAIDNLLAFINTQRLSIAVLINNAGIGSHKNFSELDEPALNALLTINIDRLVQLTRRIIPSMIERQQGLIVNIASVYSYASVPGQVLYAASKAFVKSFSIGLAQDLKTYGIKVSCVCPGSTTQTRFRQRIGLEVINKRFSAPANQIAKQIYRDLKKSHLVIIPCWYNRLFVKLLKWSPEILLSKIISYLIHHLRKTKDIKREQA